jgi:hypothetical protein
MKHTYQTLLVSFLLAAMLAACSSMPTKTSIPTDATPGKPTTASPALANPTSNPTQSGASVGEGGPSVTTGVLELKKGVDRVEDGFLHISGEVINHTGTEIGFVKVVLKIYDKNGKLLLEDKKYSDLQHVKNGGSAPFEYVRDIQKLNGEYARYEAAPEAAELISQTGAVLTNVSTGAVDYGQVPITGVFTNTSGAACENPNIVAVAYNKDGLVVTVEAAPLEREDYDYVNSVKVGEVFPFSMKIDDAGGKVLAYPTCNN